MANLALDWQQAAVLTAGLGAVAVGLTAVGLTVARGRVRRAAPAAREATIIAALYTLWQLAGAVSLRSTDAAGAAFGRARWIERVERDLHLPSEAHVQDVVTGNAVLPQVANVYYATMHFGALFVFLLWLFFAHRDRYRPVRRVLALTTFACLLIQLVPVAPPRLLPGFTDTALKYGQSVYGLGFGADQLSAMPSVHVAWAVLVGWTVWRVANGPWRWLGPVHAVLTVVVVVATANHFWADGIVAVAVLVVCAGLCRGAESLTARATARARPTGRRVRPDDSTAASGRSPIPATSRSDAP